MDSNHLNPKLYWLPDVAPGRLAISARPRGGDWLDDEIEGWRKQGIDVVVSLLTPSENEELGVKDEGRFSKAKGVRFISFPIEDRGTPPASAKVQELVMQLGSEIQQGKEVLFTCRRGMGGPSLFSVPFWFFAGENAIQALGSFGMSGGL